MEKGRAPPSASKLTCALRLLFCLGVALLAPIICNGADRKESGGPWIATAGIIRNGEQPGSGVYLKSGPIITAAHLTAIDATMSVTHRRRGVAGKGFEAGLSRRHVDLSLLLVDEQKLPARLPKMQLCEAPPRPTDPVIVVDCQACLSVPHRLAAGAALYVANKVFYPNP
jgi:hypothetical protein